MILVIALLLSFFKLPYWYNTLLSYPAGFLFAIKQKEIVGIMRKYYLSILCLLVISFIVSFYYVQKIKGIPDNFASICFALIVVMLSMKIQIGNKFLNWCGTNLFPIYIYQRIPMIIMNDCLGKEFVREYSLLFVFTALIVACIIAYFYKFWQIKRI